MPDLVNSISSARAVGAPAPRPRARIARHVLFKVYNETRGSREEKTAYDRGFSQTRRVCAASSYQPCLPPSLLGNFITRWTPRSLVTLLAASSPPRPARCTSCRNQAAPQCTNNSCGRCCVAYGTYSAMGLENSNERYLRKYTIVCSLHGFNFIRLSVVCETARMHGRLVLWQFFVNNQHCSCACLAQ